MAVTGNELAKGTEVEGGDSCAEFGEGGGGDGQGQGLVEVADQ